MLKLDDIHVYYGQIHALKGISLEVEEGELVALLGANGAGKSTTLMTISRILRQKTGSISFEGKDISLLSPEEAVKLGIIQCPEGRRIFPGLSVHENLLMGGLRQKNREAVNADMEKVFALFPVLHERLRQSGATLSGGEQQMLAIGRALMAKPRLLLLDEPSLGLAPLLVQSIFRVIKQLNGQGVTILLVEQNARQAMEIASRCYLIETGQISITGPAQELRTNPEVKRLYLGGSAS